MFQVKWVLAGLGGWATKLDGWLPQIEAQQVAIRQAEITAKNTQTLL